MENSTAISRKQYRKQYPAGIYLLHTEETADPLYIHLTKNQALAMNQLYKKLGYVEIEYLPSQIITR